jgi:hypothetical protein
MRTKLLRAVLAAAVLTLAGHRPATAAAGGCDSYTGEFTAVSPAECPSFLTDTGTEGIYSGVICLGARSRK